MVEPPTKQLRLSTEADIGVFVAQKSSQRVTDHEKYQLVVHQFNPDPSHKFPKADNGRSFQHKWLSRYPWLRYSKHDNGGYCLPCVLFARCGDLRAAPGVLVNTPLTNFQKALELLNKHADKIYHKRAVVAFEEFVKVMTNKQPSIRHRLDEQAQQQIDTNRKKLQSIVETIILCGRQNISLRGHRDSSLDVEKYPCASHGNFWALLEFRVSSGDINLRHHLANAPANGRYTSPDIQNQVIDILGDHVQAKIFGRVKEAQFFSLVADEVTDCSNKEQLGVVLRYVNPEDLQIREDFVQFIE